MTAPLLIFSHANSYPAGTYNVLLTELRRRGFDVRAPEKLGHDPRYPVSNNWPHLAQELTEFVQAQTQQSGQPAFLAGHSLGGILSLMVAARHPELARGVVLIDSLLASGWRATGLRAAKRSGLIKNMPPGSISRKRRTHWASEEEVLELFRHKKAFSRWDPQVLRDYVRHGTHDEGGQRVLSFKREVETALYNTLPDNLESLLKRHPLKCPAAFIGGIRSEEMQQFGMALTEKITKGRITMLDGSHLFPMERPLATAAAIEAALLNLHDQKPAA